MSKYIDVDALMEIIDETAPDHTQEVEFPGDLLTSTIDFLDKETINGIISDMPATDVEPVRHGYWKYNPNAMDYNLGGYCCSECGTRNNNLPGGEQYARMIMTFRGALYCPNCGAKMDGGSEE